MKALNKNLSKQTLKIFWSHSIKYPWLVFGLIIGVLALTALDIFRPFLSKWFFDALVSVNPDKIEVLFNILIQILFLGILNHVVWRIYLFMISFFEARVMSDLANTCFEYLHLHSYRFFSDSFVGSLVTKARRLEKAFEHISDQSLHEAGRTALLTISIVIALFMVHPALGWIVLAWSLVFVSVSLITSVYKLNYDFKRAAADTKTTGQLADTIANNINLKLFTSFGREFSFYKKITEQLFEARKKSWFFGNYVEIFQGTLVVVLEFGLMYYSFQLWQRGELSVGDFALIQAYLGRIFEKLWNIGKNIRIIYESMADANEMTELLLQSREVIDQPNAGLLKVGRGDIQFEDITFAYDQQKIFKKFNLHLRAGEKVAFVGQSGGGKTTIVKLLFRFFDLQEGKIFIDSQDIAAVTQESLRKQIGLVPQEPILFHRSLFENIQYGKPGASKEEVLRAAKLSHCHEFISKLPEGYETFVGERGVKLSGGERQRVAIARAILKNAPILVLDEATSSLDSESESLIQDALHSLMQNKTTIVIAHRLSTIMQMDRIIVIEDGKVAEQGKHKELLKAKQGIYQKLWGIQAGGFSG